MVVQSVVMLGYLGSTRSLHLMGDSCLSDNGSMRMGGPHLEMAAASYGLRTPVLLRVAISVETMVGLFNDVGWLGK